MDDGPDLLIGDRERGGAEAELRRHYESGRLTLEELEQRVTTVHAARTAGDLEGAFRQLPARALPSIRPRDTRWASLAFQYALVNVVVVLVWLFSGAHGSFWPKWVILATLILFLRRVRGPRRRREHPLPAAPPQLPEE